MNKPVSLRMVVYTVFAYCIVSSWASIATNFGQVNFVMLLIIFYINLRVLLGKVEAVKHLENALFVNAIFYLASFVFMIINFPRPLVVVLLPFLFVTGVMSFSFWGSWYLRNSRSVKRWVEFTGRRPRGA